MSNDARLRVAGANTYAHRVETIDARPRCTVIVLISLVLVWALASFALPRIDVGAASANLVGERIGPMTDLVAIASDRPTTTIDDRRSEHLDSIPALVSAETVTRSALKWLIGDMRFPSSLIATSRLAAELVRRGPPFSLST